DMSPPSAIDDPVGASDFVTTVLTHPRGLSISFTRCEAQLGTDEALVPKRASRLTKTTGRNRTFMRSLFHYTRVNLGWPGLEPGCPFGLQIFAPLRLSPPHVSRSWSGLCLS